MALSVQTQQSRQHGRGPEEMGHDFDAVKKQTIDRSISVKLGERNISRTSGRNCRPIWHVKLKVFDISKGMAELYGGFFVSDKKKGIWHTNVVVFGLEYFYVSTICICPVGMGWPGEEQLTEVLDMGTTERTAFELEAFLRAQQRLFTPNKYDMFKHNCNHFSDLVLRFLNHRLRVPSYIASLPERVLQTTLGKLVYPLVNAAMDRKKSDICQHADKAELCGEIFFYGGVMPLLVPGERSTQVLMKRVVEEFKQQQLQAVAHRGSTVVHRSKLSCKRDRPAGGAVFLCNRSSSQRAAAVAAFYSDTLVPCRTDRARCTDGNEGRVWWSKQAHRDPELQHRQRQRQQERSHGEHILKGLLHARKASSGRHSHLQGTTGAGGDAVPPRFSESCRTETAEHLSVPEGGVFSEKEKRHVLAGGVALSGSRNGADVWRRTPEKCSTSSMPLRRERPRVAASQHAVGKKDSVGAEVSRVHEEKQQIHRGNRSSGKSERASLPCQWKSPADFFHMTDDASSSPTGAVRAEVAQQAYQRAGRCLRGVSSAYRSDSSGCSESYTHGRSLSSSACPDRTGMRAVGHTAGHTTAPTSDVAIASSDVIISGEKHAACDSVRAGLTLLHRSRRGADACLHDHKQAGRGTERSPALVSSKPAAEALDIRNLPCSSASSASTIVGSRTSGHDSCKAISSSSGSRNNAYSSNSLRWNSFAPVPKSFTSKALQPSVFHAESPADEFLECLPLQSLRLHCPQTAEEPDITAKKMPYRNKVVPPAAPDEVVLDRLSAPDFSGDAPAAAPGRWNSETKKDFTGRSQLSSFPGNRDCGRNCDGDDAPEDALHSSRRLPSSLRDRHVNAAFGEAAEESDETAEAWMWTSRDSDGCHNRRHTVTSEKVAPVEGDVGVEDTARSRQSNDYSTVGETNDNCADCETHWLQQQWRTQQLKEEQNEHQDLAYQQVTEVDKARSRDRGSFLHSLKCKQRHFPTENTFSGPASSVSQDLPVADSGLQREPHLQGQVEEPRSSKNSPMGRSDNCSCMGVSDAVSDYAFPGGEWSSAARDGIVLTVSSPELTRNRSASVESEGAASEPAWQDAEEDEEIQESEGLDGESQSGKLPLPAVMRPRSPFMARTGKAEDSSNEAGTEVTPADSSFLLKCSTSTVPPGSNRNSFESASDCCFLESAHENEEETEEEFQEAKEGRTSSEGETEEPQTAYRTTGCKVNASCSEEVGSVKLCAPGSQVSPTISWQARGREGNARLSRQSTGKTCVFENEAHVASLRIAEAAEPEDAAWQSLLCETSRDGGKTGRCRQIEESHDPTHAAARGSGKTLCGALRGRIASNSIRPARAARRADMPAGSKDISSQFDCSRPALDSFGLDDDEDTKTTCDFLCGLEGQENNGESRRKSPYVCSDWWQQREEGDTSAAHSVRMFPEVRTAVAATCHAPSSEQHKQEASLKDDFEVLPSIRCEDGVWRFKSLERT